MKINWRVRAKSASFWAAMIGAVVAFVYQLCGIVGVLPPVSEDEVTQIIGLVINILVALGIIVDPTTAGIGDSKQALGYQEPRRDE